MALAPDGRIALVGVTESLDLSATTGTIGPAYRGGNTDAFVALIDPGQPPARQLAWATYLGGTAQEGPRLSQLAANGGLGNYWLGNLKGQDVVFDPGGDLVVVTVTNPAGALLTFNAVQSTIQGGDLYLCWISNDGRTLNYGTYFGGSAADVPAALAVHPAGGVVVAGYTGSTDMPTTSGAYQQINHLGASGVPADGMLCWIDPRLPRGQHLRYATYCGGDGGEDLFTSIAIDRSGLVTVAGTGFGGGQWLFPTTPDPVPRLPGMRGGAVVQLVLDGNGPADLVHGLLLGDDWTVLEGVAVDEAGGVVVVGATNFPGYPTSSAYQPAMASWLQGVVTRRPLLPSGSSRREQHLAEPACAVPLRAGLMGAPVAAGPAFSISASNAPPLGLGALVLGGPRVNGPAALLNAMLLVEAAMFSDPVGADARGFAQLGLTVPAGLPRTSLHVQWVFLTNAACPGSGPLSTSERLVITTF